ncbi:endonuclease/exonuclease/phosphatase family protein [Ferrimonas sediminicola]|uniref:Endonuclease/exonuclease/phosphatase family protein n=1 Tax=Ferrimonas sediminicola TaxID=2569538 RepID=A0A4U1BHP6_9GAMM|nr:endonuclease/exonuclease/phosphatase family protein [Ferrimonas sediminicola]TKB50015.1 endonuclease/exonuclease/phosphatase family protein [Ferrimonas sediminicola]
MSRPSISLRVATFNVSMEADNYRRRDQPRDPCALERRLRSGRHRQIRNLAEILQRVRPDVVLLNEFDHIKDPRRGSHAFQRHYLSVSQNGQRPIHYRHHYCAPVNSGEASPLDIDGDGVASATAGDAWGFGHYPGQYGMLVLSRFPIAREAVRSLRLFPWHKMPGALEPRLPDGSPFYDQATWRQLRLSSKAHWDLPIKVRDRTLHLLAAHPTPPVFDGPERRNAARNFDEIRLWADYVDPARSDYLVDDCGGRGGLAEGSAFVIAGDYNASPVEGRSLPGAIEQLLEHPLINGDVEPASEGGRAHSPDNLHGPSHTADWRARVDYLLPSRAGIQVSASGVFWPEPCSDLAYLVAHRRASSDHRLVWLDLQLI